MRDLRWDLVSEDKYEHGKPKVDYCRNKPHREWDAAAIEDAKKWGPNLPVIQRGISDAEKEAGSLGMGGGLSGGGLSFGGTGCMKPATVVEVVVGPGEGLLIPAGWWHSVEALSTSFSTSVMF